MPQKSWQHQNYVPPLLLPRLLIAALICQPAAHAARPLITDDARTVDAYACQVESWVKNNRNSREYWALPACNFTGNLVSHWP